MNIFQNTATITILSNDEPGGVFGFESVTDIVIRNEAKVHTVNVVRSGGDLARHMLIAKFVDGELFHCIETKFNLHLASMSLWW